MILGMGIFTPTTIDKPLEIPAEYENTKYMVKISQAGILNVKKDREAMNFVGRVFRTIQGRLRLKQIGKKFYDPTRAVRIQEYNMEIWPGYNLALN